MINTIKTCIRKGFILSGCLACLWTVQTLASEKVGTTESATETQKESKMIVKVNEEVITQQQVQDEIRNMMAQFGGNMPKEQLSQMQDQMEKQAVENLINKQLLWDTAQAAGNALEQSEIDAEFQKFEKQFPSPEQFEQRMTQTGLSETKIKGEIRRNLMIQALLKDATKDLPPATDKQVKAFFDGNPDKFVKPEQVQASHILLKVEPTADDATKSQKRLELAEIKGQLDAGSDFDKLAKENSNCPSSQKGGDLGFFSRGQMVKAFEDAAFTMKTGEVSDIVETQFGYHLIKVTDKKESEQLKLEDVKDQIAQYLFQQKQEDKINQYVAELRNKAEIEYAE